MTSADVEAVFDLVDDAPDNTNTTTSPDSAPVGPDTSVEATAGDNASKALYPNVAETFSEGDFGDRNDDGLNAAYLTPSQFSTWKTLQNVLGGNQTESAVVKDGNVYAATKAVREPLPVVLVFADDVDPATYGDAEVQKNAKVYLNRDVASSAWDERTPRGTGERAPASKRTDDELFKVAAQKRDEATRLRKRMATLTDKLVKAEKLEARYGELLADRSKTWDDVVAWESTQEGSKEISDSSDSADSE